MDIGKLRAFVSRAHAAPRPADAAYDARVASEYRQFSESRPADELPEIYQHWSNTYLRPRLLRAGFDGPLDLFRTELGAAYERSPRTTRKFLGIGSGESRMEIGLARHLIDAGMHDFVFECMEINPELVLRANALAVEQGVHEHIRILRVDANRWSPAQEYDGVVAISSLHHIQNLEGVFDGIAQSLLPTGTFVTSDTIGRNGHMRWPEALAIVEEYWRELPDAYRFNCQLKRQEHEFVNWDCSGEGFEGIRAQDILPLLVERFDFDFFAAFANIVDPFIDRTYGHNFDSSRPWDRDFVRRLEARDRAEIVRGNIKPTHLVAAMCVHRPGRNVVMDGLTPRFCIRDPARAPRPQRPLADTLAQAERDLPGGAPAVVESPPPAPDIDDARNDGPVIELCTPDAQDNDYVVARVTMPVTDPATTPLEVAIRAQGHWTLPAFAGAATIGLGRWKTGHLEITSRIGDREAARTFTIRERAVRPGRVLPPIDYSDLWWNPGEPGWGLGIHQHANGQLVAFWLGYGADGATSWFSLQPGAWTTERLFEGIVHRHRGSPSINAYDARAHVATAAGAGSLDFTSWRTATLTWMDEGEPVVKAIERMDF